MNLQITIELNEKGELIHNQHVDINMSEEAKTLGYAIQMLEFSSIALKRFALAQEIHKEEIVAGVAEALLMRIKDASPMFPWQQQKSENSTTIVE